MLIWIVPLCDCNYLRSYDSTSPLFTDVLRGYEWTASAWHRCVTWHVLLPLASIEPSGQRVCARCPIPAPFLAKRERAWGRLCGLFLCLLASTHVVHECLLPMLRTSCFVPRAMHPCYAERVYERTVVLLPCRTALASTLLPVVCNEWQPSYYISWAPGEEV